MLRASQADPMFGLICRNAATWFCVIAQQLPLQPGKPGIYSVMYTT